jgi:hypothetical protein
VQLPWHVKTTHWHSNPVCQPWCAMPPGAAHQEGPITGAVAAGSVEPLRDAAAAAAAAGRLWRLLPCIRILVF